MIPRLPQGRSGGDDDFPLQGPRIILTEGKSDHIRGGRIIEKLAVKLGDPFIIDETDTDLPASLLPFKDEANQSLNPIGIDGQGLLQIFDMNQNLRGRIGRSHRRRAVTEAAVEFSSPESPEPVAPFSPESCCWATASPGYLTRP